MFWGHTLQIWVMGIVAFSAAFLECIGAVFPVMALDKATVAHSMFIDDLPLVIGSGVLYHSAVGGRMVVNAAVLGAPGTPQFLCYG